MTLHSRHLIIGYLALPVVIFWWGWFPWWVALGGTLLLLYLGSEFRFLPRRNGSPRDDTNTYVPKHSRNSLFFCLVAAFVWTYWGGVGGFRPQHFDYFKHNLILNNLVRFEWPIHYADGTYLCYYLAYYLPAAALAKVVGGVAAIKFYIFGWTWLGLSLLFYQLQRLGGWKFVLFFMFFNSPEAVLLIYEALKSPHTITHTLTDLWTNDHTIELIQTPGGLMFPSHVESFTAAPQHSLAAWLVMVCLIPRLLQVEKGLNSLLELVFCVYWSPLVAVGLVPFVFYETMRYTSVVPRVRYFTLFSVAVIALPALIFYAGHVPLHDLRGWWWTFLKTPHEYALLATFLLVEIGLWAGLLWFLEKKHPILGKDARLIWCALGVLLLLSLYRYGHYNDLARRACLPATLVLCWGVFQFVVCSLKFTVASFSVIVYRLHPTQNRKRQTVNCKFFTAYRLLPTVLCLLIFLLPLKHHLRWLTPQPYTAVVDKNIGDFTPYSIHYLSRYHWGEFDVVAQYLGRTDAWYRRYLMPSSPTPPQQMTRAFYYWKSVFRLSDYEKQILKTQKINKLYIKVFDVDWDDATRQAVPKAAIRFEEAPPVPFVPTVFMTNRTLEKLSQGGVEELAKKIAKILIPPAPFSNVEKGGVLPSPFWGRVGNEVQLDCDWTLATRAKYFLLLTKIKERLPKNSQLSATIRLHQIKFYRTTGVPPVARGMLMYYNMGDWKSIQTENSILDLNTARRYAGYISDYPLPLDAVLPIFDWTIVFRGHKPITIINHLTHSDFTQNPYFKKSPLPNCYVAVVSHRAFGFSVRRGDVFRVENCPLNDLVISSRTLSQEIQNRNVTFALYHLDSTNLSRYVVPTSLSKHPQKAFEADSLAPIFASFR